MKALLTFKKYRPNDQRLEPNEDIYLELELRPRSDPNEYEKKKQASNLHPLRTLILAIELWGYLFRLILKRFSRT